MSTKSKLFQTQDLNLSAVLIAKGFTLSEITKAEGNKSTFCFVMDKEIDVVIQAYWNNTLEINPQTLFHALRTLKNRIYSNY